jgi:hypothetical protein
MLPKPFRASELTARVAELIGHASPNVVPFAAGRRPD